MTATHAKYTTSMGEAFITLLYGLRFGQKVRGLVSPFDCYGVLLREISEQLHEPLTITAINYEFNKRKDGALITDMFYVCSICAGTNTC